MLRIPITRLVDLINVYDQRKGSFRRCTGVDSAPITELKEFLARPQQEDSLSEDHILFSSFRKYLDTKAILPSKSLSASLLVSIMPQRTWQSILIELRDQLAERYTTIPTMPWYVYMFNTSGIVGHDRAQHLITRINSALEHPDTPTEFLNVLSCILMETWGHHSSNIIAPRLLELLQIDPTDQPFASAVKFLNLLQATYRHARSRDLEVEALPSITALTADTSHALREYTNMIIPAMSAEQERQENARPATTDTEIIHYF